MNYNEIIIEIIGTKMSDLTYQLCVILLPQKKKKLNVILDPIAMVHHAWSTIHYETHMVILANTISNL